MDVPPAPGLFVAGTDTDAGKTVVAATIVGRLAGEGLRPGVYKPAASGGDGDARTLWEAAGRPLDLASVCPQSFRTPIAPHHAAREEGRRLDEALLVAGLDPWRATSDVIVVEGAGGLFSPLSERLLNVDLALRFGFPVVIVDGGRLGCVGRVLATVTAARARGLVTAAVVISQVTADDARTADDPTAPRRIAADGVDELRRRLADLPVALLPHRGAETLPALDWMALASRRPSPRP